MSCIGATAQLQASPHAIGTIAEKTKGATEEIAETIRGIQTETHATLSVMLQSRDKVEVGLSETTQAHGSLQAIIESSKQVEGMIYLIAAAASEQTSASGEIASSASHISQLAGENSQAASETADACPSLPASSFAARPPGRVQPARRNA